MQMSIAWHIAILLLTTILCINGSATGLFASTLWGANVGLGAPLTIWEIDVNTGGASRLTIPGSDSRAGVLDFASDPFRNPSVVWSLHNTSQNGYELLSFNTRQQRLLSNVPLDDSLEFRGLAIDPLTGLFYGASETALHQIDPATSRAEMIGETSLRVDRALGFDLEGNLFSVGV